jgi:hypothetical protein
MAAYDDGTMKVFDLRCAHDHHFEGWFGSEDDYVSQVERGLLECPLCGDKTITKMLSAPRLNLSSSREVAPSAAATQTASAAASATAKPDAAGEVSTRAVDMQTAWLQTVRRLIDNTVDVGDRFAEEARRIHYGEKPERGIRGQATPEEREALRDEGIETMAIPVPAALKGPVQ